jgi:hypothetical protein
VVDDVRIYDYPLSEGEVGWLAARPSLLTSRFDVDKGGVDDAGLAGSHLAPSTYERLKVKY